MIKSRKCRDKGKDEVIQRDLGVRGRNLMYLMYGLGLSQIGNEARC